MVNTDLVCTYLGFPLIKRSVDSWLCNS